MASLSRFERKALKMKLEKAGVRVSLRPGETGTQALARASQRVLTSKDAKVQQARRAVEDDQQLKQAARALPSRTSSRRAQDLLKKSQAKVIREEKARGLRDDLKTKGLIGQETKPKTKTLTQTIERKQTRDTGIARREVQSTRQRITEPGFNAGGKLSREELFFTGFGFGKGPQIRDTRVSQRDIGFGEQLVKRARELEGKKVRIVPGTSLVKEFGPVDSKIQAFGTLIGEKAVSFSKRVSRSEPVAAVTQSEIYQKIFKPQETIKETELFVGRGGKATIARTTVLDTVKGTGGILSEAGDTLSDITTTVSKATGTPFKDVIRGKITGPSISERAFKVARQNVERGESLLGFAQATVGGVAKELEEKPLTAVAEFGAGFAIGGGAGVLAKGTSAVKGASTISNVFQSAFLVGTAAKVGLATATQGVVAGGAEFGKTTKSLAAFGIGTQLGFKSAIKLKTSAHQQFLTQGKIVREPKKSTKIFGEGSGKIGSERVGFKIAGQGRRTFSRGFFEKAGVGFKTFTQKGVTKFKLFDPKTGKTLSSGVLPKPKNIPGRSTGQVQIGDKFFKTLTGKLKTQTFATKTKQTKELFFRFDPKAKSGLGSFTIKSTTKPKFDIVRDIKLGLKLPQRVIFGASEAGSFGNVGDPFKVGATSGLQTPSASVKVDSLLTGPTGGASININALAKEVALVSTPKLFTPVLTGGVSKPLVSSEVISGGIAFAEPLTGAKSTSLETSLSQVIAEGSATSETTSSAGTSASIAKTVFRSVPQITPSLTTPGVQVPSVPIPPVGFPPIIPVDFFGGFQRSFSRGKGVRGRQARAKSPSLFAAGFGVFGERQRGGAATGLGLRLLTKKKKKKKRGGFNFNIAV